MGIHLLYSDFCYTTAMKYKALMLDVDGTLVPYDFAAVPSDIVAKAVQKAQEKVIVCIVTGRDFGFIQGLLQKLGIQKGYAVVNNGAQVVELGSEKLLYERPIEKNDANEIIKVLREERITFYIKQNYNDRTFVNGPLKTEDVLKSASMFFASEEYPEEKIDVVFKKLSHLSAITGYKSHHSAPDAFGLNITHVNATKLHGVEVIMKTLDIKRDELIGVGDSYNDFALLMACGVKVAMGNAIPELKEIADYIAPSVRDDGVADVIYKFILNEKE